MRKAAIIGMIEEGDICCICERELNETYGRPLACEDCGGDGVIGSQCPTCGDSDCAGGLPCETGDGI